MILRRRPSECMGPALRFTEPSSFPKASHSRDYAAAYELIRSTSDVV
jgi:hypothetical protein